MGTAGQTDRIPTGPDKGWRGRLPEIVLGLGVIASGLLLLHLTRNLTFVGDDWYLLLRQGWGLDQLLAPHNEHPVVAVAFIYKVLQAVFGMDSARPAQVLSILTFLLMAVLFFVYVRRRVGAWAAVIMTFLVLFLGAAYEDLLWAFQIGFIGSLAAGLGALIALDRDDRAGDVAATILLVLSLTFSSVGVPFVAAAFVEWLLNPRDRGRRLLVPVVPTVAFALWWLGWGHEAESQLSAGNIPDLPSYTFDAVSAGLNAITGLIDRGDPTHLTNPVWGKILFVIVLGLAIWRMIKLPRIPRGLLVVIALALSFYLLAGLNQNELRPPFASRYQLPSAVFLLLIAAWLLAGIRIRPVALVIAGGLSAMAIVSGVTFMAEQVTDYREPRATNQRSILGAIDLAGEAARPDYAIRFAFVPVPWTDYRATTLEYGSTGYSEAELLDRDAIDRHTADQTLIDALGVSLDPAVSPSDRLGGPCGRIRPGVPSAAGPDTTIVNPGGRELVVSLSRFGDPPGVGIGTIPPRGSAHLVLPADRSERPWNVTVADGSALACPPG